MKVGVVTFHHAKYSYGACLQALATVLVLRDLGHEAELIDYENAYEQRACKDRGLGIRGQALTRLNWFVRMYAYGGRKAPYRRAENLDRIYQCTTAKRFRNARQMDALSYDVLLAGSDQIWNPQITDGLDRAFLLDFGRARRRVSYASSMGSHRLSAAEREVFRGALRAFSAISVREEHARNQLQGLTDKRIEVVLDPTLLLREDGWREALALRPRPSTERPYLLAYFVADNLNAYWNEVRPYAAALGLPLRNVQTHARANPRAERVLCGLTLREMLEAIQNAAFVITDSFHGTAFSVIFQKPFVAVPNTGNPLRVEHLLNALHLADRMLPAPRDALAPIDDRAVRERLDALRRDSLAWLATALVN